MGMMSVLPLYIIRWQMNCFRARKSNLEGAIAIPASKSHTLRAILFGALAEGKSVINNYLRAADTQSMIHACRLLGAKITSQSDRLEIVGLNGNISKVEDVINAGNSGIVCRFITAIAALSPHYTVITGDHSIRHQRPIGSLLVALQHLGAKAISTKGDHYAPVIIQGPLQAGTTTLSGEDSQPVSALLIASAFVSGTTEIYVKNPGEKPWILLTLDWFDRLGIRYENHEFSHYCIFGKSTYQGFDYTVPSDLSSAAFPIAAAIITHSELTLNNIDMNDSQGDKAFIYILQRMGANIEIDADNNRLTVKKGSNLQGMTIDINAFIDAVCILAVVACFASGETRITNAAVARQKECDRLHAITVELQKMGAKVVELSDGLIIQHSSLRGAHLHSHSDHRIAMSLLVAGLAAEGETVIENVDCIAKTYPDVAEAFQSLGAHVEMVR